MEEKTMEEKETTKEEEVKGFREYLGEDDAFPSKASIGKVEFENCTPHAITMNDGTVYMPTGNVARVKDVFSEWDSNNVCEVEYGDVEGLPEPKDGTMYIVASMVLAASDRRDLVAPATNHPGCLREDGRIVSVPGFVRRCKK